MVKPVARFSKSKPKSEDEPDCIYYLKKIEVISYINEKQSYKGNQKQSSYR